MLKCLHNGHPYSVRENENSIKEPIRIPYLTEGTVLLLNKEIVSLEWTLTAIVIRARIEYFKVVCK